ncbi:hypothetical protein ACFWPK_32835 [Nocardia sp. NPDC058519]|uniref:hypothetical protein n=1 Tax=Nocardia sp. NPDC058519 TaxID=3346535 RepID=UPI00366703E2
MSDPVNARVDALNVRAAQRSMSVRKVGEPPYGWQLANPFRVVCHGSLDNVEAWITAAEQRDVQAAAPEPLGSRADF